MKNFTLLLGSFLVLTFTSCNVELISDLESSQLAKKPIKNVDNNDLPTDDAINLNDGTHCEVVRLMAGQHYEAGIITVDNDGQNLIITYSTNGDWTINATHLSIIDCSTESFPTTNAGNPQIGQFEYADTFEDGVHVVVYTIPLSEVSENYCFAAHAEVTGPTGGETAWGEGKDFGGESWAMYVEANLSDCNGGGLGYG
jgi:glucose/arabinose dehydrogenase